MTAKFNGRITGLPEQYLYIIRGADCEHKIGIAAEPKKRLQTIQTERRKKLSLVSTYRSVSGRASEIEIHAHSLLADRRIFGEWFAVTEDEAISAVEQSIATVEKKPMDDMKPWTIKSVATDVSNEIAAAARRENTTIGQLIAKMWDSWKNGGRPIRDSVVNDLATLLHAVGSLPPHIQVPNEVAALISDYATSARNQDATYAR